MKKFSYIALALSLILLFGFSQTPANGADLVISSERGVHTKAWKGMIEEFEEETGYDVELVQFPYSEYHDKLMFNFAGNSGRFDVVYISLLWYREFANAGYLYPIDNFNTESFNLDEVAALENSTYNDHLYILPYMNELGGIVYRKDLFNDKEHKEAFKEEYGYELAPPKTTKQYEDIAEYFNNQENLYGTTMMGQRSIFLTTHFMNRLWALGGSLLDENMRPVFNSEAGVEALKETKEFFKYTNPAAKSYGFQDALIEFVNGRSAMAELWTTGALHAETRDDSQVKGKVGFTGFPRPEENTGEELPMLYISWGFSVTESSENKEAARAWLEFITSKDAEVKAALPDTPGGNIPARNSALSDPELVNTYPWLSSFKSALNSSSPTPIAPLIPEGTSIIAVDLAEAVSKYITGQAGAERVLDQAAKSAEQRLEEGGYYD